MVFFELITGWCFAFWIYDPKHCIRAMFAMLESSSFDMPMPIGCPFALSFGAAFSTWSQVAGDSPTSFHRSWRQTTGSGTYPSEKPKNFFVFGLYVLLSARLFILLLRRWLTSCTIGAWSITWSSRSARGLRNMNR